MSQPEGDLLGGHLLDFVLTPGILPLDHVLRLLPVVLPADQIANASRVPLVAHTCVLAVGARRADSYALVLERLLPVFFGSPELFTIEWPELDLELRKQACLASLAAAMDWEAFIARVDDLLPETDLESPRGKTRDQLLELTECCDENEVHTFIMAHEQSDDVVTNLQRALSKWLEPPGAPQKTFLEKLWEDAHNGSMEDVNHELADLAMQTE